MAPLDPGWRYTQTGAARFLHKRPLLITAQGGAIAVDQAVFDLWQFAQGRTLPEIIDHFAHQPDWDETRARAILAALTAGRLLTREGLPEPPKAAPSPWDGPAPLVSVVIVTYNSRDWLRECLPSLAAQSYPALQIILIDNGSSDDTLAFAAAAYPQVIGRAMQPPASLAAAINAGVALAEGSYLLLLNPDTCLEADAVAQMVRVALQGGQVAAVVPKLRLWWAPAFLNGIGNRVPFWGFGADNALGHLDLGQFDHWEALPSACFAATLIPRAAWDAVGPLDEGFPMYYEDAEWSYRARLLGWQVRAAPAAVVYHAFGGRVPPPAGAAPGSIKLRNVILARHRFVAKIPGRLQGRFVLLAWLDDLARLGWAALRRDAAALRAVWAAWRHFGRDRAALKTARRDLQTRRRVADRELFDLPHRMPPTLMWRGFPELTWEIIQAHYLPPMQKQTSMPELMQAPQKTRLLILSHEVVAAKMAGPGMRYLEMARALQDERLQVTLAIPAESDLPEPGVTLAVYRETDQGSVRRLLEGQDVALISGYLLNKFPFLAQTAARRVVDWYDPLLLENLHYHLELPLAEQQGHNQQMVDLTNRLARLGDFFLCGNERQRDFWLGVLAANGRLNPQTYAQDSTLRALLDVAGVGFPARPPKPGQPFLRGTHPQIPAEAHLVLWGGGIWNWLDPLTLIRAWPGVIARYPLARLVFLGTRHPNPLVPGHQMAQKAVDLAGEVGERDRTILFVEWVDYEAREQLLLEADVGVTLHPIHVETRYSARTRVLDYLWARLPVLITEGDVTSEWVQAYGVGRVVPEGDPAVVTEALCDLLSRPKAAFAPAFEPLLAQFTWERLVAPLRRYCLEGTAAPDRSAQPLAARGVGLRTMGAWVLRLWRTQGVRAVLHRLWRYLQWRFS